MLQERRFEYLNNVLGNFMNAARMITIFGFTYNDFVSQSKEAGFTGMELMDNRLPLAQVPEGDDFVKSIEQSYRGEESLLEALKGRGVVKKAVATYSFLALPHISESLENINKLKEVLGGDIPVVIYPVGHTLPAGRDVACAERENVAKVKGPVLFQPTGEVMHAWQTSTIGEMVEFMRDIGFSGFAVDTFHGRRNDHGFTPISTERDFALALDNSDEIHVGLGRIDIPSELDTIEELADIYYGKYKSRTAEMLRQVGQHTTNGEKWKGRVKLEVVYPALCQVARVNKEDIYLRPRQTWIDVFSRLNDNVRHLLEAN